MNKEEKHTRGTQLVEYLENTSIPQLTPTPKSITLWDIFSKTLDKIYNKIFKK